jgi:hypothetical protein
MLLQTQQRNIGFVGCNNAPLQLYTITRGAGKYEPMTFKCFHSEFTPSHSEVSGSTPLCLVEDGVIASGVSSLSCFLTDRALYFLHCW